MYIYFVRYFKCNISAFCIFKESNNLLAWSERTKLFSFLWLGLLNLRALSFYEEPVAQKLVYLACTPRQAARSVRQLNENLGNGCLFW